MGHGKVKLHFSILIINYFSIFFIEKLCEIFEKFIEKFSRRDTFEKKLLRKDIRFANDILSISEDKLIVN